MDSTLFAIAAMVLLIIATAACVACMSLLLTYYCERAETARLRAFIQKRAGLGDDEAIRLLGGC